MYLGMDHFFAISQKNSCAAKTVEKQLCMGSLGEKNEHVFSTIQVLFLMLKKILAQGNAHPKSYAQSKGEKIFFNVPEDCPTPLPPKTIMVCPLVCSNVYQRNSIVFHCLLYINHIVTMDTNDVEIHAPLPKQSSIGSPNALWIIVLGNVIQQMALWVVSL